MLKWILAIVALCFAFMAYVCVIIASRYDRYNELEDWKDESGTDQP